MLSPNLQNAEYGCVLLLGGSGTGKSYGLKEIINVLQSSAPVPRLYTINVRDLEYTNGTFKKHSSIGFDKVSKIKEKSLVVIEDIINLSIKEEIQLRNLLNYDAHHKKMKVFCVSHNIFKTKLYNTISYFKFIVFTSAISNLQLLKKCFQYFAIPSDIIEQWCDKIQMFKGQFGIYFYFDTNTRIFYATNNIKDPSSGKEIGRADVHNSTVTVEKQRQLLQNRFEIFFKGRQNASQANAVFSIIVNCLKDPLTNVRPVDLTLTFYSTQHGNLKRVSLVDYVNTLLDANPTDVQPPLAHLIVHKYINSLCNIPNIFVLNPYFAVHH